jgi:hypothetical protein
MKPIIAASAAMILALPMAPMLSNASPQSDDTASSANSANGSDSGNKTRAQKMNDCMAQQKATNSSSMSKSAMETVCKNQLKKQSQLKHGNDLSTGPQNQQQSEPEQSPPK